MPELPVSVRLALWVTAAWAGGSDLAQAVARAHPDADDVGGDLARIPLWGELGEGALLVALPAPGDAAGMPATSPDALAAATAAGECVLAPSLGGVLVPQVDGYGPSADRGLRVRWTAYDAAPVPRHLVEAVDVREAARGLARAVVEATEALERLGGEPFDPAARAAAADHREWALPPGVAGPVGATIRSAAAIAGAAETGLHVPPGAVATITLEGRERVLRRLRRDAERALAAATNAAVASLAGWFPDR
jgi:hypothetical protein